MPARRGYHSLQFRANFGHIISTLLHSVSSESGHVSLPAARQPPGDAATRQRPRSTNTDECRLLHKVGQESVRSSTKCG